MQRTSLTTGRAVSERPTTLADLFDFSFNRYVTPLIVKITWMLALLLAGMWLLMTVVLIAASLVPDRSETVQRVASEPEIRLEFGSSQPIDRLAEHVDEAWDATAWRIAMLVTQVIGAVLFLLWMRVALESVIVIFNIAASLRSIDRKTKIG